MFYIFMVGNLQNIFIDGRKEKSIILTSAIYCWLLLLVTGFVIQDHICVSYLFAISLFFLFSRGDKNQIRFEKNIKVDKIFVFEKQKVVIFHLNIERNI